MPQDAMIPTSPLLLPATARRAINDAGGLGARWAALRQTLARWRHRARTRAELDLIPDHRHKDLPFDTSTVLAERDKPFWKE